MIKAATQFIHSVDRMLGDGLTFCWKFGVFSHGKMIKVAEYFTQFDPIGEIKHSIDQ